MIQESDKLIADALNKGEDYWTFRGDADKDYVHSMFAYPAMMVPKMQREILETIDEHTKIIAKKIGCFIRNEQNRFRFLVSK